MYLLGYGQLSVIFIIWSCVYQVCTAQYCGVDERPFWEAWVCALFQEGKFEKAKEKVANVFRIGAADGAGKVPDDAAKVESRQAALRLVRVLETTSPVDVEAFKR